MPCKSVIFAGDSPYLNTMNYRQMSGRAGRRGFDLIGHVTFFGIPEGKIKRLITSKLADMRGNLPLTIALYEPPLLFLLFPIPFFAERTWAFFSPFAFLHLALPSFYLPQLPNAESTVPCVYCADTTNGIPNSTKSCRRTKISK